MLNTRYPVLSRLDGGGEVFGSGWSGVVYITDGQTSGSGVLTESGLHILTASHVVDDFQVSETRVIFPSESEQRDIQDISLHPEASVSEDAIYHDLALVTLELSAPASAERYSLYEQNDELGQAGVITGYGQGVYPDGTPVDQAGTTLREGLNTIDTTGLDLKPYGWEGSLEEQLLFDYDDGSLANDTLGNITGAEHLGLGDLEAMITSGDSGGGLFLSSGKDWQLAGIHSYTSNGGYDPEAPLGDIGGATRVSSYTEWILHETAQEQQIQAQDSEPPSQEEVPMQVSEGQGVYFLVELPGGAAQQSSVEFFTRDGSAQAGLDYIPTRGEIEFETGDKFAKVWVQTLTDDQLEGDEDFELVLTNPKGANFPEGQTELAASRVITEDGMQLAGVTDLESELFGEVA